MLLGKWADPGGTAMPILADIIGAHSWSSMMATPLVNLNYGGDLLLLLGKWADPGGTAMPVLATIV